MNTTETSTVHSHQNHTGADADTVAMAEMLELDAEVLGTYLSELTAWLDELTDREPRRIVDLGSGTGTGAIALARRFARADVTAVDLSPQMLHRLTKKASALGLADRVIGVQADLNDGWPTLDTCDLVWAAASLHHMADPDHVLAGAFDALRPGGLLALTEMDFFPRFLPDDIGVGSPGLEARIHAALSPGPAVDWTDHLARTGFALEARRPFTIDLPAPLPTAAARYAQVCLRKLRSHLDEQLPAEDLAALDAVLDSEGPHSVLRREDLTVRTTRTTWAARRL
ncbi:class I SAM-dependent methyltransferase [Streptomyces sp. NBC_01433]|uniref:class I SAM-dependent methyltransferase n=1 Tax=Streptomyces sp. NBC_01433 TaxID=2903864 RepID=UPI00224D9091|nr:class I SAM-dependent methyltransferase [Streptomyces sp. NBC_01433]MCX4681036.1 class I SAM-dependent methyltransferase [Streptomyces sp. NBC_01433]